MKSNSVFFYACALFSLANISLHARADQTTLVVHEWGTFTSLQDESGAAIGGINTDDEPVPKFVHRLSDWLLLRPTEMPPCFFQGAPACHPGVTMRLETPVIYFHPSPSAPLISNLTVRAQFNGGWLSEFYPSATAAAPGLSSNTFEFGPLRSDTISSLAWSNLDVGGDWSGPATAAHVWTSPRAVQAANVRTADGEAERFLFYRGVAHLNAPLRISIDSGELAFRSQLEGSVASKGPLPVRSLWLVDIRPDGRLAFKSLPPLALEADSSKVLTKCSSRFQSDDYRVGNLEALRQSLQSALITEGLFADEAQALLNTWELSYFKSTGLRVFFLVPRAWTDAYLPLQISAPAKTARVMVGRIELITPVQRDLLRQLGEYPYKAITNDQAELHNQVYRDSVIRQFQTIGAGEKSLEDAQVSIPKSYDLYLRLGRFRQTLVLTEQATHPSDNLKAFINYYALAHNGLLLVGRERQALERNIARHAVTNSLPNAVPSGPSKTE